MVGIFQLSKTWPDVNVWNETMFFFYAWPPNAQCFYWLKTKTFKNKEHIKQHWKHTYSVFDYFDVTTIAKKRIVARRGGPYS